jgi:hypothetical protein
MAKYLSRSTSLRERRMLDLIKSGRVHTFREAGEQLGVSRQRVHQVAKQYGVSLPKPLARQVLPRVVSRPRPSFDLFCIECGKKLASTSGSSRGHRTGLCRDCWRTSSPAQKSQLGDRRPLEGLKDTEVRRREGLALISVFCPDCGRERWKPPYVAARSATGLCITCFNARKKIVRVS